MIEPGFFRRYIRDPLFLRASLDLCGARAPDE
jgi:hypothetical protein